MSRLTLGIFFSLVIVMFITAYNYTPQTVEGKTCQVGTVCSKPDCCNKEKSCGSGCVKPCCKQNVVKTCGTDCEKPCCSNKIKKQCGANCAKSCCSKT